MGKGSLPKSFISDLYALRDGDLDRADYLRGVLNCVGLEFHSRAIVGSGKVCWVPNIQHDAYLEEGFSSILDTKLRLVNAIQTSLNDWLESGRPTLIYSIWKSGMDALREGLPEEPSEASIPSYAVVVSAVVLLSLVYQYLTGNVDRGGSKAYSRSSLDFRDIYVAIVLFLGAYVWIKFREVAPKGVHPRTLVDKQGGTKEVYEARLTPPMWNGRKVPRLELGRFATPQEAHNKFLIAAFYYNRRSSAGLLDGWFQVPPMSEEERSLTGLELRAWVIGQAKKVYEDFEKKKAEAALFQELFEGCEVQGTPGHDEVNVGPWGASLLNPAEPRQLVYVSQAENSGMGMAMIGDSRGLECAFHSFDRMHEGLALPNSHSLGSQEGSVLTVSQLPPNTESGMSLHGSDQLDLLQTRLGTFQQQISDQQQQIQEFGAQILQLRGSEQFFLLQTRLGTFQQQIFDQQQQIQEFDAQILQLQHQQRIQQQQQLQESRIQNPMWPYQFDLQQQHRQGVNQGAPGLEMEIEQSMHQHKYPGLMASPPDGGEVQEAFWEMDTLL